MLFVELDDDGITLSDMKRIANHILENYKELHFDLTDAQKQDLSVIVKPSLEVDESTLNKHWQHLLDTFVVKNSTGEEVRFYTDESNKTLYFATADGIELAESFVNASSYPEDAFKDL